MVFGPDCSEQTRLKRFYQKPISTKLARIASPEQSAHRPQQEAQCIYLHTSGPMQAGKLKAT